MREIELSFKQPIVETVKLNECIDTQDMFDTIVNFLKKRGIYKENLLYSGFDAHRLNKRELIKKCTTRKSVYCSTEGDITAEYSGVESALDHALDRDHTEPCLAIFDGNKLTNDGRVAHVELMQYEYIPTSGHNLTDALIAILRLAF